MEILTKYFLVVSIIASSYVFGQDNKSQQIAFENSYLSENKKDYEAAIKAIKSVYTESSYPANLRLGWLFYVSANYSASVTYYKKAIALMPAAEEPYWGLINAQTALEKWVDVEKSYLAILKLDAKNKTANYQLGLIYYYRKNYTSAKKYFDVALNLYPFDYNALLMSAWTNYFLGKSSEAKVLFNRVLLHYKTDSSALEGLSLIK